MNPALWGLVTALGWGNADFIARFTGRALGHESALLGMLGISAAVFVFLLWVSGTPLVLDLSGWWLLLLAGIGAMVATLLLYWGLARGPVTLVAPLVGTYPALNVAFAVALGVRPSMIGWAAMLAVMAGVLVIARAVRSFEDPASYTRAQLRKTIGIALASSLIFAATVAAAQEAAVIYGELQTVVIARWIGLFLCAGLFLVKREAPRLPVRWWPILTLQGLLDGGVYLALVAGGVGEGGEIAIVVSSGFGAVTVLLARVFLREAMTWAQWGVIVLIVGGVAVLSSGL